MAKLKRVWGKRHSWEFRVSLKELESGNLSNVARVQLPRGLTEAIEKWKDRRAGQYPPTHRLKKDWEPWGLKKGSLFHVPARRFVRSHWDVGYNDSSALFYKVRPRWVQPLMVHVTTDGFPAEGGASWCDGPASLRDPWFKEHFERVKDNKS